jgi:autotransporter strand-loop-strand O-heptosyltransferase
MEQKIEIRYVTTLPKDGNGPSVIIKEKIQKNYIIEYIDRKTYTLVKKEMVTSNQYSFGNRQWYTNWLINVYDDGLKLIHSDIFNPEGKIVFIKIDGKALGDNLAWVPYVKVFKEKHNCTVICSTFFNEYFKNLYPELIFVEPNTKIENVYAQYYVGSHIGSRIYSPNDYTVIPLQQTATDILGLEYNEVRSNFEELVKNEKPNIIGKYVCISEMASSPKKGWSEKEFGWQLIVDVLQGFGFNVVVISKEPTSLKNVINKTGDIPLKDRMIDIYYSQFFIGVSSGLSWLSWSLGKPVMMISEVTPKFHEFKKNIARIGGDNLKEINYETEEKVNYHTVMMALRKVIGVD